MSSRIRAHASTSPSPVRRKSQRIIAQKLAEAELSYTSPVHINSLPDELLAYIIQHLPWRERIRAESVDRRWRHVAYTFGWADFKHFSCSEQAGFPRSEIRLRRILARCGNYVESFDLNIETDQPAKLLKKCPRLARVRLVDVKVEEDIVDCLLNCSLRYHERMDK